ncbi:MAG TPA: glycoside hydrolase family 16 protein [Candidatus Microsaccharimonas sp.]|jgi:beta-glucanase (GH16 family)
MNKKNTTPEDGPHISRRNLLIGSLIGAGALTGALGLYQLTETLQQPQKPEFETTPSWQQDFLHMNASTLDSKVWRYDQNPDVPGYNQEYQGYTTSEKNVRIEPGVGLVLEAHKESYTYPNDTEKRVFDYTSGKIDTLDSFNFEYGKVEATIKMSAGAGAWPAFWLLSANEVHTSGDNVSKAVQDSPRYYMKDGEIDIMEFYGQRPNQFEATVHTFNKSYEKTISVPDISEGFHTYGVELSPNRITWTLDGKPCYTFDKPSDNPDTWPFGDGNKMYVILNLAMGGSGGGPVDTSYDSWRMDVQNVSYYKMKKT